MSNQPSISAAIGNQNLSQSDTREATIEPSILMEIADRERLLLLTLMVKRRLVIWFVVELIVELIANTKKQVPHVEIIVKPQMFGGST